MKRSVISFFIFAVMLQTPMSEATEMGKHSYTVGSEVISFTLLDGNGDQLASSPIVGDLIRVDYPQGTATGKFACKYFFDVVIWHNNVKVEESFQVMENSLAKPAELIQSPGVYEIEIIGESHCRDAGPKDLGGSMNARWVAFTAVEEIKPTSFKATKMTCNPSFKISKVREYSYICETQIMDKDHVMDRVWITPADGTRISPGTIEIRNSSKTWKRTSLGWTIKSTFKLLTVSPYDYSKLRAIERIAMRVDMLDAVLAVESGFNRLADPKVQNFVFTFKK